MNNIRIAVEETQKFKNGKRQGVWRMSWGHSHWTGTWKSDQDDIVTIAGDPVLETPISQEALEELIYCTQED